MMYDIYIYMYIYIYIYMYVYIYIYIHMISCPPGRAPIPASDGGRHAAAPRQNRSTLAMDFLLGSLAAHSPEGP